MSGAGMVRVPAPAGVKGEKTADISKNKMQKKKNQMNKTKQKQVDS